MSKQELTYDLEQLDLLGELDESMGAEEVMGKARDLFQQMKEIGERLSTAYDQLLSDQS